MPSGAEQICRISLEEKNMTDDFKEKLAKKLGAKSDDTTPPAILTEAGPKLGVFRLDKRAKLPIRAHSSDVGWDLFAHILTEAGRDSTRMIPRFGTSAIPTGLIVRPPLGHYCQVCSRTGWALQSVFVANAPGIVDPEYIGELTIILYNGSHETKWISHGQRVGQLVLAPIVQSAIHEITDPPAPTPRGAAGFGSSGL